MSADVPAGGVPPASAPSPAAPPAAPPAAGKRVRPAVLLLVGMAGSGKSTLLQRLRSETAIRRVGAYAVNLDPAVASVPFPANVDIRDTVNYKRVMEQYALGPNGAIVTCLNLFATRFDQVVALVRAKAPALEYVLVDTPGQIEVFAWSASGTLITSMLAEFPTVIVFVVDTVRVAASPSTFMATMLYACSVMYKSQLPFVLAFNKADVASDAGPREWMADPEAFQAALDAEGERGGYTSSLMRSLGWALDAFYGAIAAVSVSAATGAGVDDLFAAADAALDEEDEEDEEEGEDEGEGGGGGGGSGEGANGEFGGLGGDEEDEEEGGEYDDDEQGGGGGGGKGGGGGGARARGRAAEEQLRALRAEALRETPPGAPPPRSEAGGGGGGGVGGGA